MVGNLQTAYETIIPAFMDYLLAQAGKVVSVYVYRSAWMMFTQQKCSIVNIPTCMV